MTIPKGADGDRLAARVTIPLLASTGYEALKERYRKAVPLLAELLHIQRVFTGEVKLVRDSDRAQAELSRS
jgi:hypothetical protein